MRRVYLDNSATTRVDSKAANEMVKYMIEEYGNPSSVHNYGQIARCEIDDSREKVAKVINANIDEIFFTSGGTESDNWAIRGVVNNALIKGKKVHLVTSSYEHSAIDNTVKNLNRIFPGNDISYTMVSPDNKGYIHVEDIEKAITENTILVSVMHINSEIGTINDIKSIGKMCRRKKVLFHTDAVQSFGKIDIDVRKFDIDLLSMSAHKIHGPKGVGALFVRKNVEIEPMIYGGSQESRMRMGTENLPGIAGFGFVCENVVSNYKKGMEKIISLRKNFLKLLGEELDNYTVNSDIENGYPGVLNITFHGVEGEAIALSMAMENFAVSTGSACSSGSVEPSRMLLSLGLSKEDAQSSIRFSFGLENICEDIELGAKCLIKTVKRLRSLGM
ncbi:MAG: cysteine desulfurase NifS [Candidatus Cloacimonadota bacterium]|nr:MAG: cysteine desulfurase NifS [Candidatus Cloacimonadota bacterium]PIE78404.1 MAG: cysteine desulfurase NifS [Candidatus Delongbacteria bacterium]